ncbi:MAG TPA: type 4a pilus biogenesis protein PilO [Acidimicrobiales bacterium]|nr:type 4a pilus biogenesis protein PilO [Acidimicrobiales bacterium]
MSASPSHVKITRRGALVALAAVAVLVAWVLAFYLPQTHKLHGLNGQRASLQSIVAADQARLQRVKKEAAHVSEITAIHDRLQGYAPSSERLYTYIHTISAAAKSAGVKITSLSANGLAPVPSTSYSAVPVTATIKGTYDELLTFLKRLYDLPRLTDVNDVYVSGGGRGSNRGTLLSVTLQLAIFTSQTPSTGAAG